MHHRSLYSLLSTTPVISWNKKHIIKIQNFLSFFRLASFAHVSRQWTWWKDLLPKLIHQTLFSIRRFPSSRHIQTRQFIVSNRADCQPPAIQKRSYHPPKKPVFFLLGNFGWSSSILSPTRFPNTVACIVKSSELFFLSHFFPFAWN